MNHIEAMKQALEALEMYMTMDSVDEAHLLEVDIAPKAITALRQAIEQAEQAQPVAWINWNAATGERTISFVQESELASEPLYTSPPPRQPWAGLTDEDKQIAFDDTQEGGGFWEFADAIEATLRKKNHG